MGSSGQEAVAQVCRGDPGCQHGALAAWLGPDVVPPAVQVARLRGEHVLSAQVEGHLARRTTMRLNICMLWC